jgi:hypothetical protein
MQPSVPLWVFFEGPSGPDMGVAPCPYRNGRAMPLESAQVLVSAKENVNSTDFARACCIV